MPKVYKPHWGEDSNSGATPLNDAILNASYGGIDFRYRVAGDEALTEELIEEAFPSDPSPKLDGNRASEPKFRGKKPVAGKDF